MVNLPSAVKPISISPGQKNGQSRNRGDVTKPPKGEEGVSSTPPSLNGPASGQSQITLSSVYLLPSERPDAPPFSLLPYLKAYPCNLPSTLLAFLKHDGHDTSDSARNQRYRRKLLKSLKSLRDEGVIDLKRGRDGLCQWLLTTNGLYLIRCQQNPNSPNQAPKSIYSLPRQARKERYEALKITASKTLLSEEDRFKIEQKYDDYTEDVIHRSIVLTYKEYQKSPDAPLFILPYITRFTSFGRKKANLTNFERCWQNASLNYQDAVFLTLTTDPGMHRSVYHANKHFWTALNRFLAYYRKKRDSKLHYIAAYEFQHNGLLHAHLVLFGIKHLDSIYSISRIWQRCRQGRVVYAYRLTNNNGSWNWSRRKPSNASNTGSADRYLKKYLRKALFDPDELYLYWTFNKRYFSNSRALNPATPRPKSLGRPLTFIGSFPNDMISVELARRSRLLWSQATAAESAAGTGPPW